VKRVAEGLDSLGGVPGTVDASRLEDGPVDERTRWAARTLVASLRDRPVTAHALTHGHPDRKAVRRRSVRRST
jgi:hypothetical protein